MAEILANLGVVAMLYIISLLGKIVEYGPVIAAVIIVAWVSSIAFPRVWSAADR